MSLFRNNATIIKKLLLNQFGAAILGILMSSATAQSLPLNLATSIFAAAFYMYLIYSAVWDAGARERIRVDGGRAPDDKLRGLRAGIAANLPNIIFAVLCVAFTAIGVASQQEWAGNASVTMNVIARVWHGMYNGIIVAVSGTGLGPVKTVLSSLIFIVIIIPGVATAAWGYIMGYNGKRIFPERRKTEKKHQQ